MGMLILFKTGRPQDGFFVRGKDGDIFGKDLT